MGDFNVDSKKPYIETNKIPSYPGFKEYPHLSEGEHFNEYEAMVCYLSKNCKEGIEDLLLNTYGEHPITYADSYCGEDEQAKPLETVLTHKDDLCSNQSLDYIFRLYPKQLLGAKKIRDLENQPMQKQSNLRIPEGSARVEKFFIDGCDFTQLSDHYGTMVTLEYGPSIDDNTTLSKTAESNYDTFHQQHLAQQSYDGIIVLD